MSNLKTLGLAAVMVVVVIVLTQLRLMALVHDVLVWLCAAAMLGCAVIWGRMILGDARRGKTSYRRLTWEASPDVFVTRSKNPGIFWRLIFYKVLSLVFMLALAVVFVLIGLGVILVA